MSLVAPRDWLDTDAFMYIIRRPVPDNQEVFVEPQGAKDENSLESKPVALFVDILEAVDGVPKEKLPHFHAQEILKRDGRDAEASSLELSEASVVEVGGIGADRRVTVTMAVFEGCDIEIAVVCLPAVSSQVIISMHGRIRALERSCTSVPGVGAVAQTLQIHDWGLFGGDTGDEYEQEGRLLGS